jgi:hypothetical protein
VGADGEHLIAKEYLSDVELDAPLNEYRARQALLTDIGTTSGHALADDPREIYPQPQRVHLQSHGKS